MYSLQVSAKCNNYVDPTSLASTVIIIIIIIIIIIARTFKVLMCFFIIL